MTHFPGKPRVAANRRERGRPRHADVLTPAEWRVVEAVRHGLTNPQIAQRQGVSLDAVKYHVANILLKLGFARRAELRRWHGVRRASNLAHKEPSMETQTSLGPVGQIARSVKDITAARRWYGDVLGLPHLYSFGTLAFFDCGGVRLFLSEGEGAAESILYFRVEDIQAMHATLTARGVEFINTPHLIHQHEDGTEEWMAFFKDNEGRPLAIMAQVGTQSAKAAD
ncbi:LuxR C-terminal-related transcriptional regulator [Nitrospirillum iridis]|uniref:DNA-binding CsgD family transcriptional regulator/extradiol dioxygenase family protein n=1 Tax=Nitrospirillum iridis TaxID=765888 RepID=A0A7X0B2H3_9PROT|nr:LuxR C-terminal-related transcriptional regulator [Nitrospirillum iridis]MBB6254162.1 DNA-binding CsgD family transcriptional regulator/extradiol dioxygenase family protein [Nitrospirillum iridis]